MQTSVQKTVTALVFSEIHNFLEHYFIFLDIRWTKLISKHIYLSKTPELFFIFSNNRSSPKDEDEKCHQELKQKIKFD